ETLYMGVPYVTLAGRPSVGRLGSSILEGVGHPEWIAHCEEEYIEKAIALASDLPKLAELRARLRPEMEASPLMDEAGFARKVETAYREMFARWINGAQIQAPTTALPDAVRAEPGEVVESPLCKQPHTFSNMSGPVIQQLELAKPTPTSLRNAQPTQQEVNALAALFNEGRHSEGVTLARSMSQRFPLNGFAWKVLGALLSAQGDKAEAQEPMQKSAQLSPNDEQAQTNLGLLLGELNQLSEAEACHRRALAINPQFAPAHQNL
ncbi:MAG: hypothetical protein JZU63_05635, partial [Rhodoferax sp.]|nr:hypothetical protein [Rhodoferax sp.]